MHSSLIYAHSYFRYFLLILLVIVVFKSLMGWLTQRSFTQADDKFSLWLLIATHLQFLVGLVLYFMSDLVKFNSETMKNPAFRYWTVEHSTMMILAVVLITVARITQKKLPTDQAKHKRMFLLNAAALVIIIIAILASGRGLFIPTKLE